MKWEIPKLSGIAGKYKYVVIVLAAGLLLMTLPSGGKESRGESARRDSFDVSDFENRIEKALSTCSGVGRCEVIVTLDSGTESVFAREQRESMRTRSDEKEHDIETSPTTISGGSGVETPMLIKERSPKFRGALVVCDGAASSEVQSKVIEAVSSLTGLTSDRISVIKMKN